MKPAILLDRDGTIIIDKDYLNTPDGVELLPGAIDGLVEFTRKGYVLVVVTNQSGVARGLIQEANIHLIHKRIDELLAPHGIRIAKYYYNTTADAKHPDRKPNPGMLVSAIRDLNLDAAKSWMIGDRQADVEAGMSAGVRTMFVENDRHKLVGVQPVYLIKNLVDAAKIV